MAGMNCEILNLKWPGEALPQQLSNFETAARRLRYQALGIACRKRGIRSILMAHHNDDQTETVLLRTSQGHRGIGLLGIQPVAEIPECWGIHGVHQSEVDEADLIISKRSAGRRNLAECVSKRRNSEVATGSPIIDSEMPSKNEEGKNTLDIPHHGLEKQEGQPLDLESGGMKIYRPLLGFSKDRLKVTCMTLGVEWIEDETNRDPTLTSRNAIRHVLESGKLPLKLQKRSILTLRKRIQLKHQARMEYAEKVYQGCDIMMLDTRSAVLVIRFPSRIRIPELAPAQEEDATNVQYRAALLLQRVANLVTPMEHVSLQSLEFAVDCIFPDVADASANNVDKAMKSYKFTVAGVSFERIDSLLLPIPDENPPHDLDRDFIWVLTRQPYHSSGKLPTITIGPGPTVPLGLSTTHPIRPVWAPRNRFQLWDGRFWLRIENPLPTPLVIRPFHLTDLTFLRASLPKPELDDLHARLRAVAPGKVRWTLPVIAELEDDGTTRGGKGWDEEGVRAEGRVQGGEKKTERIKGQVLALPTLGWGPMAKAKGVRWEARYKKADLGAGRDMSVVT